MKNIDEIYKEWCGEHHTTNSGHPVHDSAEVQDFAEFYHKEMVANECQQQDATAILPHVSVSDISKYCKTQLENSRDFANSQQNKGITYQKYMAKYFAYKDVKDWIKIHSR